MLHHAAAQLCDNVAAKNDFLLDSRIAQVQITVFQTCIFIRFLGTVDLKRKLVVDAFAENRRSFSGTTSISPVGRFGFLLERSRTTPETEMCGLRIYTGNLLHHFLGLDHDLCRAIKVTQNQEAEIFAYSS